MSSDLPNQLLLQQHSARPVSGEELETYGKCAADGFHCGKYPDLTEAVVEVVKTAGLSPEQVRRVVEFTNTHAFLTEFKKTAEPSKYVHFNSGLADPSEVLKDLNDGGGGTVLDPGTSDYAQSPEAVKKSSAQLLRGNLADLEKTAGVSFEKPNDIDRILEEGFKADGKDVPYANPLSDVEDAQQKLATAIDAATSEITELEGLFAATQEDLYNQVKQAAFEGVPMGHVVQAWVGALEPNMELMKTAWRHIGSRLVKEQVFSSYSDLGESLSKTASEQALVNEAHPMVATFAGYCETITKLATIRAAQQELLEMDGKVDEFLKLADQHLEAR